MSQLDLGELSLYWEERGSGTPIVFVHGIPTDYRAWQAQVDSLSGTFRTVTYSRRYAYPNRSAGNLRDSTVENNAHDLAGLIERCTLAPVHLVGHSFGGFIAAYLATQRPDLVRTLSLLEPAIASLLLENPESRSEAIRLLLRHPRAALSASQFLRTSNRPAMKALEDGDFARATQLNVMGVEDRTNALGRFSTAEQQMMLDNAKTVKEGGNPYPAVTRHQLSRISRPTLVLHGETSALWLRTIARITAESIPGSELGEVAGAGHYPHIQQPAQVNEQLGGFLHRH